MSVDFYPTFSDNNKARGCGKVANMFSPSNRVKLPNQEVFAYYEVKRTRQVTPTRVTSVFWIVSKLLWLHFRMVRRATRNNCIALNSPFSAVRSLSRVHMGMPRDKKFTIIREKFWSSEKVKLTKLRFKKYIYFREIIAIYLCEYNIRFSNGNVWMYFSCTFYNINKMQYSRVNTFFYIFLR